MPRLFIGLPVDDSVITSLREVLDHLSEFDPVLKTIAPNNLHVTLKFLGETDEDTCSSIVSLFSDIKIIKSHIPFDLKGLGAFPDITKPGVIWCGIKTENSKIEGIQKAVEDFTGEFGFERDKRKFSPHLTLARVRRNQTVPGRLKTYLKSNLEKDFCSSSFRRLVLFESTLTDSGPVYRELDSIELI